MSALQSNPAEQVVTAMEGMQQNFLETMAAANERGLSDAVGRPLSDRVAAMRESLLLHQGQSG